MPWVKLLRSQLSADLELLRACRAMSEPHSGRPRRAGRRQGRRVGRRGATLFQKLVDLVAPGPESRDQLIESLADAETRS